MKTLAFILVCCALTLAGCPDGGIQGNRSKPELTEDTKDPQILALRKAARELAQKPEESAEFVEVQHLLISFDGAGTPATRTKEQAEKLAAQVYAKLQSGSDFDALVKENTDDQYPGVYGMVSEEARQNQGKNIFWRKGMVPAFGNVGWRLKVGEIGVAAYDSTNSPYGWHIVKRTK
jgi:parvulin-like peptidyl-prolyl isomerase